jgi:hypothetical protein
MLFNLAEVEDRPLYHIIRKSGSRDCVNHLFVYFESVKTLIDYKLMNLSLPKRDWYRRDMDGRANLWIHSFV